MRADGRTSANGGSQEPGVRTQIRGDGPSEKCPPGPAPSDLLPAVDQLAAEHREYDLGLGNGIAVGGVGAEQDEGTNFYQLGMQNSRGFRALKVWLALRAAGRRGYEESIRQDVELAQRLHERVAEDPEFAAGSVHLSITTFRFVPQDLQGDDSTGTEEYLNRLNQALLAEIQAGGELYVSNAIVDGRYLLRACIVNFRTSAADIDALPGAISAIGRRLDKTLRPGAEG